MIGGKGRGRGGEGGGEGGGGGGGGVGKWTRRAGRAKKQRELGIVR